MELLKIVAPAIIPIQLRLVFILIYLMDSYRLMYSVFLTALFMNEEQEVKPEDKTNRLKRDLRKHF